MTPRALSKTKTEVSDLRYRPTWAEIDLAAFRQNVAALGKLLGDGKRMIVVLKADGYGHGATALAHAITRSAEVPLWGFGVSSIEEGISLRTAGIKAKILVLGSLYPFDNFKTVIEHKLTPTVASLAAAQSLEKTAGARGGRVGVHVKIDTGMGRIGVSPEKAAALIDFLSRSSALCLEGLYTHLAQADSPDVTSEQLSLFKKVAALLGDKEAKCLHVANSAATILYPESHFDAVRPGLSLYGIYPTEKASSKVTLAPVMTWKTRVVFLKTVQPGTRISYGGTFQAKRASRLATFPVGYADGYRRDFSNRAQVLVKGCRCPVVGRVTMDQTIVDVTDVRGVDVGEEAVLLGAQGADRITAEEMAIWANTIPYEITCGISRRVPRVIVKREAA